VHERRGAAAGTLLLGPHEQVDGDAARRVLLDAPQRVGQWQPGVKEPNRFGSLASRTAARSRSADAVVTPFSGCRSSDEGSDWSFLSVSSSNVFVVICCLKRRPKSGASTPLAEKR
jgi:hypothetical protein